MAVLAPMIALMASHGAKAERAMSLTLSVEGGPPGLEAFLVQRVRETWDTSVGIPNRGSPAPGGSERAGDRTNDPWAFSVAVDWQSADQLSVLVRLGDAVLTEVTIEVHDPVHAKLTLWLLLKSTIERYRALPGAAPKEVTGENAREPTGNRSTSDTSATVPAAVPRSAQPRAEVAASGENSARRAAVAQRAKTGATVTEGSGSGVARALTWGAMVTVWLETPRLLAVGVAGLAVWRWETVALGLQLGYRFAPGPDGLSVHAMPVTGTASIEMGDRVRAGVGVMLIGELKIPITSGGMSVEAGAEAGLYVQARIEVTDDSLAFLRFANSWRIVRKRYRYHDTSGTLRRTREAPWTSMVTTGVEWL